MVRAASWGSIFYIAVAFASTAQASMVKQPYVNDPQSGFVRVQMPTSSAKSEIRKVIESQLAAFPRGDAERAFSFASPNIRKLFGTAETFMAMVRQSYATVFDARQVYFRDMAETKQGPMQPVLLIDQAGRSVIANYLMQQQPGGEWRINGVTLHPISNQGI